MKAKRNRNRLGIAKILRKMRLKKISFWFNTRRHHDIGQEILPICKDVSKKIKNKDNPSNLFSDVIWVFWWQGKNEMPELVKRCYESLEKQLYDKKIILITKDNIREYCTFPQYIFDKCESGKITITHLSDILRFDLLSHYGGLYTDATVFWTGNIQPSAFSELYTCGGYSDDYYFNVSNGRWTGFLIGGSRENSLFDFMYNFFLEYWKEQDELVDYFLIDYALEFAYRNNIGDFKKYVDNIAPLNNPNLFKLMDIRNQTYSKVGEGELIDNTYAFKLSYKKRFDNNRDTYAAKIVFERQHGEK